MIFISICIHSLCWKKGKNHPDIIALTKKFNSSPRQHSPRTHTNTIISSKTNSQISFKQKDRKVSFSMNPASSDNINISKVDAFYHSLSQANCDPVVSSTSTSDDMIGLQSNAMIFDVESKHEDLSSKFKNNYPLNEPMLADSEYLSSSLLHLNHPPQHPDPFTVISYLDIVKEIWEPIDNSPKNIEWCLFYTRELEKQGIQSFIMIQIFFI